jgi:DNA invertase Pin-like site-specific DNA recombinase
VASDVSRRQRNPAGRLLGGVEAGPPGRSPSHLLTTVNSLKEPGIGFRSLTEQMATTMPQGEFLSHVFGALAQFERSLTEEGIRAGLAVGWRGHLIA